MKPSFVQYVIFGIAQVALIFLGLGIIIKAQREHPKGSFERVGLIIVGVVIAAVGMAITAFLPE